MAKTKAAQQGEQMGSGRPPRFPKLTTGLVGYARVSTLDQSVALQTDALKKAGCVKIFTDTASGKRAERPGLDDAMQFLREGDTLVVWKLDRLGRSLQHLIEILDALEHRGVHFRSMQEHIDTKTPLGRMFFHLVGAFAQYERELISERTRAGLTAAPARGRKGGRKPVLSGTAIETAREMHSRKVPIARIATTLHCSERTVRRSLEQ